MPELPEGEEARAEALALAHPRGAHGERRGKWLRVALSGDARLDVEKNGKRARIAYSDPRKFGRLVFSAHDDLPSWTALGPDPLEDGIDAKAVAASLARRRRRSIKEAVMDQAVLAGGGNIQATEALWEAKIDPRSPAGALAPKDVGAVVRGVRWTIERTLADLARLMSGYTTIPWSRTATKGSRARAASVVETSGTLLAELTQNMPDERDVSHAGLIRHGAPRLTAVSVDTYNEELKDAEGFVGDRASNRAFRAILEEWRERLRTVTGEDPLGETPSDEISKRKLDKLLLEGDPEAAGVVHGAIEEFASELATVTKRFLRLKAWKETARIVVGGGLRASRVGELAIGRASVMLKGEGHAIDLVPIRHHPDHAGLIGSVHLAPSWVFAGHDAILAVDIGGSNIRVGIVELHLDEAKDLSECIVKDSDLWRHRDDGPNREEAVQRMIDMLFALVKKAEKKGLTLAPFIGVACPGVIEADGSIERGGQNLPGNWESTKFNLPDLLRAGLPQIGDHDTSVVMHNDAVVQGLSEIPFQTDVERWGVLTIGTGLGNARFTNLVRPAATKKSA